MSTKDCVLSLSKHQTFDKKNTCFNGNQNDQYKSINLNQNRKCEDLEIIQSKSKLTDGEKKDYAFSETKDFVDKFFESKTSSNLWKKSEIYLEKLNLDDFKNAAGSEKYKWKNPKTSAGKNNNNSTLSLHITAYENSIEATSGNHVNGTDNCVVGKNDKIKKSWKNVKPAFLGSEKIQNPFEFPRQQNENHIIDPEVMQYRASHRLQNSNSSSRCFYEQPNQKRDDLLDLVEELAMEFEQGQIDKAQFKYRLQLCSTGIGYHPSGIMSAWTKNVKRTETYFLDNNFVFKDLIDERIASIQRRMDPDFCRPPPALTSDHNLQPSAAAASSGTPSSRNHQQQNHLQFDASNRQNIHQNVVNNNIPPPSMAPPAPAQRQQQSAPLEAGNQGVENGTEQSLPPPSPHHQQQQPPIVVPPIQNIDPSMPQLPPQSAAQIPQPLLPQQQPQQYFQFNLFGDVNAEVLQKVLTSFKGPSNN